MSEETPEPFEFKVDGPKLEPVGQIEIEIATLPDFWPKGSEDKQGRRLITAGDFAQKLMELIHNRVPEALVDDQTFLAWTPEGITVFYRKPDPEATNRNQLRELLFRYGVPPEITGE